MRKLDFELEIIPNLAKVVHLAILLTIGVYIEGVYAIGKMIAYAQMDKQNRVENLK